jgi:hypothetical protein
MWSADLKEAVGAFLDPCYVDFGGGNEELRYYAEV